MSVKLLDAIALKAVDHDGLTAGDRCEIIREFRNHRAHIDEILDIFADNIVDAKERKRLVALLNLDGQGQSFLEGIIGRDGGDMLRRRLGINNKAAYAILSDSKATVAAREVAANYLASSNNARARQALVAALKNEHSWEVRFAIAKALVKLDSTTRTRSDVIDAFMQAYRMGDKKARAYVLNKLRGVRHPSVRDMYIRASAQRDPIIRRGSLRVLARYHNDTTTTPIFLKALEEHDPSTRSIAIAMLGKSKSTKAFFALIKASARATGAELRAIEGSIKQLLKDDVVNASVHLRLMRGGQLSGKYMLSKLKSFKRSALLPKLLKLLKTGKKRSRHSAANVLRQFKGKAVHEAFVAAMTDKDENVRAIALEYVGEKGDLRALSGLMVMLTSRAWWRRETAVRVLVRFKDKRVADAVIAMMRDPHPAVRAEVSRSIVKIKKPGVVRVLRAALKDPSPDVRGAAVRSLGVIGAKSAVTDLLALANDHVPGVRAAALIALGKLGDPRAAKVLYAATKSRNSYIVASVKRALSTYGDMRVVKWLIRDFLRSDAYSSNSNAEDILREIRNPKAIPLFAAVLKLKNIKYIKRHVMVWILGGTQDPRVVPILFGALKPWNWGLYREVNMVLSQFKDPRALPHFVAALKDAEPHIRKIAIQGVASIGGTKAATVLLAAAKSSDSAVKTDAIRGLGKNRDPRAVSALLALIGDDSVQEEVVRALAAKKDPRIAPAIIKLLKKPSIRFAEAAIQTLGKNDGARIVPFLISLVKMPREQTSLAKWMQAWAMEALVRKKDPRVIPTIIAALKDPTAAVRDEAVQLLYNVDDKRISPALLARMKDPDRTVRMHVLEVLVMRGERKVIPVLLRLLESKRGADCGIAAQLLGDLKEPKAVKGLIKFLERKRDYPGQDYYSKKAAWKALEKIDTPEARKYLKKRK